MRRPRHFAWLLLIKTWLLLLARLWHLCRHHGRLRRHARLSLHLSKLSRLSR